MTSTPSLRERLSKDERGFTLAEMMVTTMIMIIVLFALFSIFDMSLKVFSFGNNKVEAVESARIGLEKMEREIRQAYRYNHNASPALDHIFFNTAAPTTALTLPAGTPKVVTQLTFGNELGSPGDGAITCSGTCEYITYKLTDDASGTVPCTVAPCTLRRVNGPSAAAAGAPVVENVAALVAADPAQGGLSFTLLTSAGGDPVDESQVGIVIVKLRVIVDQGVGRSGTQTLTTVIDLRNRQ